MPRCACLGPSTTFSSQFVRGNFSDHEVVECQDFPALLDCVINGQCDFAAAPLENTNNGTVLEFYANWLKRKEQIFITDLYQHQIELYLYAFCSLEEITSVRAFNPVKKQSQKWLDQHLPDVPFKGKFTSTSESVESLLSHDDDSAAAIGCLEAKDIGVPLRAKNIETIPNFTTFGRVETTRLDCTGATRFLLGIESYDDGKDDVINAVLERNKCYHTSSCKVETSPPFGIFEIASSDPKSLNPQTIECIKAELNDSFFIGCYFGKTLTKSFSP